MMRINLLPKEERGRSKSRVDGMLLAWLGVGIAVVAVALVTVLNAMNLRITQAEEAALFDRVTDLRAAQSTLAKQQKENDELEAAVGELASFMFVEQNMAMVWLLADSTRAVPEDVWLELLAVDSGRGLHGAGYAAGTYELSWLLRDLQAVPDAGHVQLETLERVRTIAGWRRKFSVDLTVSGFPDAEQGEGDLTVEGGTP